MDDDRGEGDSSRILLRSVIVQKRVVYYRRL